MHKVIKKRLNKKWKCVFSFSFGDWMVPQINRSESEKSVFYFCITDLFMEFEVL